ncbi:MAG: hypothetical protein L6R28_17890 [Planctomycetes bacterium]|nr:hypothetical protein [Planctomycetota bacterium]
MRRIGFFSLLGVMAACGAAHAASALPEWEVKRKEVFEFASKPQVTRQGDRVTITFESKDFCDATVAVEDAEGRIVRHLACGVLGPNAPEPFKKDSLEQTLVWDGKDDAGTYVDEKETCRVRVSLGLKPQFERALFWDAKKRIGSGRGIGNSTYCNIPTPVFSAAPEGVYVYEGYGVDHLRLFSHDGEYLRTVYPFPASKAMNVKGIKKYAWPQDGIELPEKDGFQISTLLTSGSNGQNDTYVLSMWGAAALGMAVRGERIALFHWKVNRLSTAGDSGGLDLTGPVVSEDAFLGTANRSRKEDQNMQASPLSGAFSPDGKKLYLTGYIWRDGVRGRNRSHGCLHGVNVIDYESNAAPKLFAGTMEQQKPGKADGQFNEATCVAVDAKGRVYVGDYLNDRVQVFSAEGKFLKAMPAAKPVRLVLDPKNDELWVFSWSLYNDYGLAKLNVAVPAMLTNCGTFEKPKKGAAVELPLADYSAKKNATVYGGIEHFAELDLHGKTPRVWLVTGNKGDAEDDPGIANSATGAWVMKNMEIYDLKGGKLEKIKDWNKDVAATVDRVRPPWNWRQRLYVNPKTGLLYLGEGEQTRWWKAFYKVVEINPASGKCKDFEIPFAAEDMAFDIKGHCYLRTHDAIVRYQPEATPWREVPFDYGIEKTGVGMGSTKGVTKHADVIASIDIPGDLYPSEWHLGGMWVNARGDVVAECLVNKNGGLVEPVTSTKDEKIVGLPPKYSPRLYPGRPRTGEVHIWDKHGQLKHMDVLPGATHLYGVCIDNDDNVYAMTHQARVIGGKVYHNRQSGTLVKVKPGVERVFISEGKEMPVQIPVPDGDLPKRHHDIFNDAGKRTWLENTEWLYGGVGFSGKGGGKAGGGCSCWNARMVLDQFSRSFAPEVDRYHVAVLDSNGNLILRVGQYGNADDGVPLVKGGAPGLHKLGGDEVALMHAAYPAVDTDRRLFIADAGNARIVSIKLNYYTEETVPLSKVPDQGPVAGR